MQLLVSRGLLINPTQEFQPLLVAMPIHAGADNFSIRDIECGEQRGRTVALIIVSPRFRARPRAPRARPVPPAGPRSGGACREPDRGPGGDRAGPRAWPRSAGPDRPPGAPPRVHAPRARSSSPPWRTARTPGRRPRRERAGPAAEGSRERVLPP